MSVHHHSQHSTAAPQLPSVSAWTTAATVAAITSGSSTPASFSSPEQWPGYTPIWDYDRHPVAPCVPDARRPPRHSHPDHILHSEPIDPSSAQYRRRSTRISSSSSSNSSTLSLQLHSSPLPKKSRAASIAAAVSAKSGRRPLLSRLLRKPVPSPSSTIPSPVTIIAQGAVPVSSLPSSPVSSPSESHDRDPNTTTQPQPQPQPQSKPQHQHQYQHQHSHHRNHHSLDSSMPSQDRPSGQRLRTSRSLAPSEHSASSLASLTEEKQFPHPSTVSDTTGVQSRADNGHRIPSSSLSFHPSTPGGGPPSSTSNSPRPSLSHRRRGVAVAAAFNHISHDLAESKAAPPTSVEQQLQQRSPMEEQQLRWHQDWLRPSGAMLSRFRDRPARFNCPRCGAKVVSVTQFVPGVMSYLVAFGLLFLTLGTLSYIPFRKGHEGTKDCVHWCPKCNQKVARYSRATATWEWL